MPTTAPPSVAVPATVGRPAAPQRHARSARTQSGRSKAERHAGQPPVAAGGLAHLFALSAPVALLAALVYLAHAAPQPIYRAVALLPGPAEVRRTCRRGLRGAPCRTSPRGPEVDRGGRSAVAQSRQVADKRTLARNEPHRSRPVPGPARSAGVRFRLLLPARTWPMTAIPADKLDKLVQRWDNIQSELNHGVDQASRVQLAKEFAELNPVVETIREYRKAEAEWSELRALSNDASADKELRQMAEDELGQVDRAGASCSRSCACISCPRTRPTRRAPSWRCAPAPAATRRPCSPPTSSACTAATPSTHGWKTEIISLSENDLGGYKEIVASISGKGVFARLKYESGVHRVQRVPATEASGRIHTSAATVAVLPEVEDIDLDIRPEDIRIDTMRAGGAGGQHVNKTDSAVRITHLPTGLIVVSAEKSQHQNRRLAMQVLRSRLYEQERQKAADSRAAQRKGQVGSGDRSQRIRTYNFPQGRVTDHRIGLTLHKLDAVLRGHRARRADRRADHRASGERAGGHG